jgi:hypothetical protein
MPFEIVGDFRLQVFTRLRPAIKEFMQGFETYKQMLGRLLYGCRATESARGVDELGRGVGRTALAAVVAVLIDSLARRASSLDETIGQERTSDWVEELFDIIFDDQSCLAKRTPNLRTELEVLGRISTTIVIKGDIKARKVAFVGRLHIGDDFDFGSPLLPSADHDRGSVRIVGANEDASPTHEALKANPYIGLNVFNEMA